nr:MAG TPA: hypothetical protein [Caudoviricetes sp.]
MPENCAPHISGLRGDVSHLCGGFGRLSAPGLELLVGGGLRGFVAVVGDDELAVVYESLKIGAVLCPLGNIGEAVLFQGHRLNAGLGAGDDDVALGENKHRNTPFSDAVHIQHGGAVHQLDLGDVCHVGGVIADVGDVGGAHDAGERNQLIHLEEAFLADIDYHAVAAGGASALDPAGRGDDQLHAVVCSYVVLLQEVVDGFGAKLTEHRGGDVAVLLVGNEDVVGDGVLVVLAGGPDSGDGVIDVFQDLLRDLVGPLGGAAGTRGDRSGLDDIGVVDQTGGAVLLEADVDVGVHMLIIGQADALLQQLVEAAADAVGALHILEHDPQGSGEDMRLECVLADRCLHERYAVGTTAGDGRITRAICNAVGDRHGRNVIDPAAAYLDGNIAGIGDTGKGLADERVALFELTGEECAAALDGCGIHHGNARGRTAHCGAAESEDTGIGGADVLEICHRIALLLGVCTGEDDQLGHTVRICCAAPLAVGQFDGVTGGLVVRSSLKAAHAGGRIVGSGRDADVNVAAESGRTALAQHIDAAALEHTAGVAGSIDAGVLVGVGKGALDLASCHAGKFVGSGAGAAHDDDFAALVHEGGAKGNVDLTARRAGVDDHIGLAGVGAGEAVRHHLADDLGAESHKISPPSSCGGCGCRRRSGKPRTAVRICFCWNGSRLQWRHPVQRGR